MIRATVKCKPEHKNSNDTFPLDFPECPVKGQIIISLEQHFFEVVDVIWMTDKFQNANLTVIVVPVTSKLLCG